ncbi:hypothetical protein Calkr_0816 [Caldicellulosiruptor acetigenus I77R1B]|uniref:Uncharacterized protein n=2 Tax=Caldicellulosiruptor acetigenus TaxID=301953 RepID=G2PZA7_9FIRM|nr:prepilin-type N-terminal cleavage/methylation domain-containing protein [Caldicellulosiruptor acetigenus]ADQ40339.1 hypothetical protein Calkr_0816 [Caldicellulosiruptor acetigenus I77R1B]AEM74125.1 hypothetical protein Calla_1517 [Caldicellulosiruptor acetigenus 6A]
MQKKGFTLIEMVIVIAIIGIIVAIGFPQVVQSIKSARKKADLANARMIAYAFYTFAEESQKNVSELVTSANTFYRIDSDIINTPVGNMKLSDYISGGVPKPASNRSWYFYYKYDTVLRIYCGDGSTMYELFPEPSALFVR